MISTLQKEELAAKLNRNSAAEMVRLRTSMHYVIIEN